MLASFLAVRLDRGPGLGRHASSRGLGLGLGHAGAASAEPLRVGLDQLHRRGPQVRLTADSSNIDYFCLGFDLMRAAPSPGLGLGVPTKGALVKRRESSTKKGAGPRVAHCDFSAEQGDGAQAIR